MQLFLYDCVCLPRLRGAGDDLLVEELLVALDKWIHDKADKHRNALVSNGLCAHFLVLLIEEVFAPQVLAQSFWIHAQFRRHLRCEAGQGERPAVVC